MSLRGVLFDMTSATRAALLLAVVAQACTYDEHLPQVDIKGTVIVPRAAATRVILDDRTGVEAEVVDARFIGPVYLGAYSDIRFDLENYPHPATGPIIGGELGDTYPYGGGTVGVFDFACYTSTLCKVVTGRYSDFSSMLDFFSNTLDQPIVDEQGAEVQSPDYFRTSCFDLFEYTEDAELLFLAGEDGLDFKENADGDFEAEFTMWRVNYHPGMKVWGWMDAPDGNFDFTTCDPSNGQQFNQYSASFTTGSSHIDLLNFPSNYIDIGDFVVSEPFELTYEDADAFRAAAPTFTLVYDFPVEK